MADNNFLLKPVKYLRTLSHLTLSNCPSYCNSQGDIKLPFKIEDICMFAKIRSPSLAETDWVKFSGPEP